MSKLVGMLRGKKIYDNDPMLSKLQCNVEYLPVWQALVSQLSGGRCDYCGRTTRNGDECKSCGASL